MAGPEPFPEHASKRQSKRTWMVRLTAGIILLGALAYGALPWWLPTGWLGHRLVNQLSADLNRSVKIERVHVGWVEGIVFEGITIADRPGSVFPQLARVERLRCSFEPLITLVTGRVDEIVVDGPTINISADETGRLNVSDLGERQEGGELPSRNFLVRELLCNLRTPQGAEAIRFDRLECSMDPNTGKLRFLGEVRPRQEAAPKRGGASPDEKRLRIDAEITVPRLKPSVALGGEIRVQWAGLALSDLPLKVIPQMPIEQVDGTTTGTLHVETEPDLHMDIGLEIDLHGVRIRRGGQGGMALVPDARVRMDGHWDPNTDVVLVRSLAYETNAIRFAGQGRGDESPAVRLDLQGTPPMEIHVAGAVKDWNLLRREWPAFERAASEAGVRLDGDALFKLDAKREPRSDQVVLSLDAPGTVCRVERGGRLWFDAPRGIAKKIEAAVGMTRRDGLRIRPDISLTLGGISLQGRSEVTLPDPAPTELIDRVQAWLETVVPSAAGEWTLRCRDLEELKSLWPQLARVELTQEWHGPFETTLSCTPGAGANRLRAAVKMDASTSMRVGDAFVKETGQPLTLQLGCDLPPAKAGRLNGLVLAARCGSSSMKLDEGATIDYRFAFCDNGQGRDVAPISVDSSWHLPIRIVGVEQFVGLWGGWNKLIETDRSRRIAGDLGVVLDGRVSSMPKDVVTRYAAEVNADDALIRWDDIVDKPAGTAMTVSAAVRGEELDGRGDCEWMAAIRRPAGSLSAEYRTGDSPAGGGDVEQVRARADVSDLPRWLEISPALRQAAGAYRPGGGLAIEFDSLCAAGGQEIRFSVDATKAAFEVPVRGTLTKSPGVDAKVAGRLRTVAPAGAGPATKWVLEGGELAVAGVRLPEISGDAEFAAAASQSAVMPLRRLLGGARLPSLQTVDVEARGTLAADPQVTSLHHEIRRWCERYGLSGRADVQVRLSGEPQRISLTGKLTADDLRGTLALGNEVVPKIQKPAGTPARLTFDLGVIGGSADADRKLRIDDLTVSVAGNEVGLTGSVDLPGRAAEAEQVNLNATVRLAEPGHFVSLMPASRVARIDGSCEGAFEVAGSLRGPVLREGRLAFRRLGAVVDGDNAGLDGEVRLDGGELNMDQLRWTYGASEGVVSGSLRRAGDSYKGRLGLAVDRIDLPDLKTRLSHWSPPKPSGTATGAVSQGDQTVRSIIATLLRTEIEIDASANVVRTMLPGEQTMRADNGWARVQIQRGPVTVNFGGLVDGGAVTGEFTSHTQVADPEFHLTYTADSIEPGPLVDGYLRLMFPGMVATGPLTLIDETTQKLLPKPGETNYEVGKGELIIHGGSIAGRAAPLWVTKFFPGLNFARFDFSYMHSWFTKQPNGQVHHQMIYQGQYYNVYMIGYADPTRWFQYEVGVDFLADFDSKYWAESGQGRIPLFVKTGRINDQGKLIEEEVNFLPPDRALKTLFVQNNPVVTAYYAVLKRVKGAK